MWLSYVYNLPSYELPKHIKKKLITCKIKSKIIEIKQIEF